MAFNLPDEILLNIALQADGTESLCALALTCRRLRPISQEALLRSPEAICSPKHVWKLVHTLQSHLNLANSLTCLRLGPWTQGSNAVLTSARKSMMMDKKWSEHCDFLIATYPALTPKILNLSLEGNKHFLSTGLAMLFALYPHIKTLVMGLELLHHNALLSFCFRSSGAELAPASLWYKQVQSRLQIRLVEVELFREQITHRAFFKFYRLGAFLDFSAFGQLRKLVVPYIRVAMHTMGWLDFPVNHHPPGPSMMFPKGLEHLCLYFDHLFRYCGPEWIDEAMSNPKSNLKVVELRYENNLWSVAGANCRRHDRLEQLEFWERWSEHLSIDVITTFGNVKKRDRVVHDEVWNSSTYKRGDMRAALEKLMTEDIEVVYKDAEIMNALGESFSI